MESSIRMEPRISIVTLGVEDLERSYRFYHDGLGFPTSGQPEKGIIFFQTGGVCLALYPFDKLAEDISENLVLQHPAGSFSGVTLAHNTRSREEVDAVLEQAKQAGGAIIKSAQDVFWGGYSGYFSDPDGHIWEVAYADFWQFHEDGRLVIE